MKTKEELDAEFERIMNMSDEELLKGMTKKDIEQLQRDHYEMVATAILLADKYKNHDR